MTDARRFLVVGSGAYVFGDRYGPGVVLRSILAWCRARDPRAPVRVTLTSRRREQWAERRAQAEAIAAECGVTATFDFIEPASVGGVLAVGSPTAVFVCVPDPAHAEYVELAATRQLPVWVVKPLTGELRAAAHLAERCTALGADVWVDYHKRFDQSNQLLRATVTEGRYGAPLHYFVQYSQPRDLPLEQFAWAAGTDPLTYIGCHYLDQLGYVFPGVAPRRAMAIPVAGAVHAALGGRAYDAVVFHAQLEWRGRPVLATLHVGWADALGAPAKSFQRVELECERGRVRADQTARGFQLWSDDGTREINPYFFQQLPDPVTGALQPSGYGYESVARFLDFCVADPATRDRLRASETLPWLRQALLAERLLAAARASLADAATPWVAVP